ncbi:hypothetical protein QQF64_011669 [Cirrhinus molitorella]|uniref:Uncharacterized protein n=1 Tax=Cirrhinus molitorella TaxID=172907 RepID=A0ABR3LZY0_9TELE
MEWWYDVTQPSSAESDWFTFKSMTAECCGSCLISTNQSHRLMFVSTVHDIVIIIQNTLQDILKVCAEG